MSNSYTGIFPALVAAFSDAQGALKAPNALLDSIYTDFGPQQASLYDSVKLNFPASSYSVTNVTNDTVSVSDVTATPKTVTLDKHPAVAFKLPDYDTMRGYGVPQLRAMFVDEAIEKITAYANGIVAALITSGNFSQKVDGGSADTITVGEAASMWQTLASAKVPVRDSANMFFIMHPVIYGALLGTSTWTGGNNIAPNYADAARRNADLISIYGAQPKYDLDMPLATGVYTSLMFHRRALALAARALESPTAGGVASLQVTYKGLPMRVTIDWNQLYLSYVMTVDALFGASVFRADHACRHTST
jgi:hypothetical protein